jgi:hypothetical protein
MWDAQRQGAALSPGAGSAGSWIPGHGGKRSKNGGHFSDYECQRRGTLVDESRWAPLNAALAVSLSLIGAKVYLVPGRKWLASNFLGSWNTRFAKGRQPIKYRIDAASPCQ